MAKGQFLDQGFQPTFRGHCSWGAGQAGGSPLFRAPDVCCALGRACVPAHVLLHAWGLCHGGHAQLLCARSLHTHHTHPVQAQHMHSLHTHCRLHACPVPALQVHSCTCSEHTQLLALCTLFPHTPCTFCVCFVQALHTPSLLTLFAHSPHAACTSCVHVRSPRSMHTLQGLCTRLEHTHRAGTLTKAVQAQ
ncbi:hypothetical protein RLOC_00014214 [Lonchura striata]|uniref:Uncharacterized protein n=1 Tax=Lonchura striata TaxID=40157 RepID=A0A218UTE5_9PASE|nr:hypothetical protein RLOC_00014214 [Lonchura striata domestica]